MKKFLQIGLGLTCSMVLLSACSAKKAENTSAKSTTETTVATTASETSATETTTTTTTETTTVADTKDYDTLYGDTISKVIADPERTATLYAFYDIDDNGTKELFTGYTDSSGVNQPLAAYYLKDGVSTYLADNGVGAVGGRRASFQVNEDGTVSQTEANSLMEDVKITLYRLKADNSGLDVVEEIETTRTENKTPASNQHPVDLTKLDWQGLAIPEETTTAASTSGIDINAIAQGDLSSIAGTYRGALSSSNTFTFNADGTGHMTSENASWDTTFTNFHLEDGYAAFNTTTGPEIFYIVPAGASSSYDAPYGVDTNRNRAYVNHNWFYLD